MNKSKAIILLFVAVVAIAAAVAVFVIVRRKRQADKKTGKGLLKYALSQVGRPYWYGTNGQTASPDLFTSRAALYPDQYYSVLYKDAASQYGQRVHDCAGLIEAYMWSDGTRDGEVVPGSNNYPDTTANNILATATESGPIDTLPEIKGLTLHRDGHVGIYAGNGKVVEAKGHKYGVVVTDLAEGAWKSWAKPRGIEY